MKTINENAACRVGCPARTAKQRWHWLTPSVRFVSMAALGLLAGLAGRESHAGEPAALFVKACAPCHSKDGKAQTPAAKQLGVKDLSLSKLAEEQIIVQIREGKQPQQKQSKMPAFKEKLTTEEIASLVAVVKRFRNDEKSP